MATTGRHPSYIHNNEDLNYYTSAGFVGGEVIGINLAVYKDIFVRKDKTTFHVHTIIMYCKWKGRES